MEQYWEWLCSIPGLYRMHQEILLRCFETPEAVWRASDRELSHLTGRGCGWAERVRRFRAEMDPQKTVHRNREKGIKFISCQHRSYPKRLFGLEDRPFGLFYRGELPEEEKKSVAIVGARMCTQYGKAAAEQIAARIGNAGGQVISGAAYGIDGAAQWAAMENGGKSYAVLGCGADRCYPASHAALFERLEKNGGLISEFPPGARPLRHHFPARNRIISGLADLVVVIEARQKSGSLITAEYAAVQGRHVCAVPGRLGDECSEGCNELISQGADIILSVDSLIHRIFPDYKDMKKELTDQSALAPSEKLVYSSLGLQPKSIWELEECTVMSLAELSGILLSLEMKGLIRETERSYYVRLGSS